MACEKLKSAHDALLLVKPGDRVMVSGFGRSGDPKQLIEALADTEGVKDLTVISNDLGSPNAGLGKLLTKGKVKALIGTYYNWNPDVPAAAHTGQITVELVPQGTFAEAIRAAGAGIPAFYTPVGVGTELGKGKEIRVFGSTEYLLQESIGADVALIHADKADELGNLVYHATARNFNPIMATAAKLVVAEVNEIVPVGSLDPEKIVTPHMYVDVLVLVKKGE